jgi:hypothetical protein
MKKQVTNLTFGEIGQIIAVGVSVLISEKKQQHQKNKKTIQDLKKAFDKFAKSQGWSDWHCMEQNAFIEGDN